MAFRRRSRLGHYVCCDRFPPKDYYRPPWPKAPSPIRIMANGRVQEIDITPTKLDIQVDTGLNARVDTRIPCHIISKNFIKYLGSPVIETAKTIRITDSRGTEYDSVGIIKATWRVQGYHNSSLDHFIVVQGDFPDDVDVLLANSEKVQSSIKLSTKSKIPFLLALFFSKETKKQDKADRKKLERQQVLDEKKDLDEKLKRNRDARQARNNNSAPSNLPSGSSQARK